jgi:hypothetical protein
MFANIIVYLLVTQHAEQPAVRDVFGLWVSFAWSILCKKRAGR